MNKVSMKIASASIGLLALPLCLFCLCQGAVAQQNPPQKLAKPSAAKTAKKKVKWVLGLVPTYDVTNGDYLGPMTPKEKFHMAVNSSANSFEIAEAAVKAEYYRGTSPRKKIGHGGVGYLKQWGASYLDEISGNMFHTFLYPALLRQDPRYYRKGGGSIPSRIGYSLSRVFVTRGDRGRNEFNASMVLGSATATALSGAYYPPLTHDVGLTFGNIGWSLVGDGASNIFKEFWPDIAHRLSRHH